MLGQCPDDDFKTFGIEQFREYYKICAFTLEKSYWVSVVCLKSGMLFQEVV